MRIPSLSVFRQRRRRPDGQWSAQGGSVGLHPMADGPVPVQGPVLRAVAVDGLILIPFKKNNELTMMKTCKNLWMAAWACCVLTACHVSPQWQLTWEDDFNAGELDTTVWSKIPRGGSDWDRHMADYPDLYRMTDSTLVLYARANRSHPADSAPYLTGGVWSRYKKEFKFGRVEVRARFSSAQGFWPAIWMCPDPIPYPYGGEIDIMEHLNYDAFVYQTSHSHYTVNLKRNTPPKYTTAPVRQDEFNTYAVEMYPDSLVYYTNGKRTICYPKVNGGRDGQFPFAYDPFHLRMDCQLGGSWVGKVAADQLPAWMEIDWVRYYERKK